MLVKSRQMLVKVFPGPLSNFVNAVNASNPAAFPGPWAIRKRPKPPGRAGLCAFATFVQVLALEVPAAVLSMSRTEGGISLMGDPPNDGVFRQITAARRALCQIPSKPVKTWTPPGPSVK